MKRVNCLYRVSSKQQLHEEDIPVQRAECTQYIKVHADWQFQKEYVEKAVSGFKTSVKDRDVLQEILKDAKEKTFEVLLVYMSDRIGRKEDESPLFVTTLNNLGIEVWTVKEGQLKTTEHIDKLLNYIRFWQAEGESRKTGMRVKDAQTALVKEGKFAGGKAPFGYRLEYSGEISNHGRALKKLTIEPEKAVIIQKIYEYAVDYNYGAYKIAKVLNQQKITAPNDVWKAATVSQILKNPIYMGYLTYNRRQKQGGSNHYTRLPKEQWVLAKWQNPELIIIAKECWQQAQQMREARQPDTRKERERTSVKMVKTARTSHFVGLLYCGFCKKPLINDSKYAYWTTKDGVKHKKIIRCYRCPDSISGSLLCENKKSYKAEELERTINEAVASYLQQLSPMDITDELCKLKEERIKQQSRQYEKIKKELNSIKEDIGTLQTYIPKALRGEGVFEAKQLASLIQERKEKLAEKEELAEKMKKVCKDQQKEIIKKQQKQLLTDWGNIYLSCPVPKQKVILSKLAERIEIFSEMLYIILK